MSLTIEDRVKGLLFGIAIGDAKGIPFENLTKEQIKPIYNDDEIYFETMKYNTFLPKEFPAGKWTDDTQLSLAVVRSIMKANGFDLNEMAKEHVVAWRESTIGWGGTKNAIKRLSEGESPLKSGNKDSKGNGVIMKIAPLAFYYSSAKNKFSRERKLKEIEVLTRMTHDYIQGVVLACFFCLTLEKIFTYTESNSNFFDLENNRKKFLQECIEEILSLEQQFQQKDELFSKRLLLLQNCENLTDDKLVEISNGGSSYVLDSLTTVMGILLFNTPSFNLILRAVKIGGDTDSNASMVGAVVGGIKGISIFPSPYIDRLYQTGEIKTLAISFSHFISNIEASNSASLSLPKVIQWTSIAAVGLLFSIIIFNKIKK